MTELVINARGLSRHFGSLKAVEQLDLQVERGQIYGFLGPNGSGKTTAIRLLTGLLLPSAGDIEVLGCKLPRDAEKLRLKIGYMTQKFSLYEDLTVMENLRFVAQIFGLSKRDIRTRIGVQLENYELQAESSQLAGSMSGGQRRRLALATATLHRPELLILDEPTSEVDPQTRRNFWEQLFDLSDAGATILVATHYMDEAERCHRLAILDSGIKRADGSPQTLMQQVDASVVELAAADPRQLKKQLLQLPEIISAAQLGNRLRVLVKPQVDSAIDFLRQHIPPGADPIAVAPNLEDVFVSCTGKNAGAIKS